MQTLFQILKHQDRVVEVEIPATFIPALLEAACIGLWSGKMNSDSTMQAKWARDRIGQAYASYNEFNAEGGKDD